MWFFYWHDICLRFWFIVVSGGVEVVNQRKDLRGKREKNRDVVGERECEAKKMIEVENEAKVNVGVTMLNDDDVNKDM